jgi:hypothetical protein
VLDAILTRLVAAVRETAKAGRGCLRQAASNENEFKESGSLMMRAN